MLKYMWRTTQVLLGAAVVALVGFGVFRFATGFTGNFQWTRQSRGASGSAIALDAPANTFRLDTSTAIVLVTSATCSACQANTDNWLRLVAATSKDSGIRILAIAAPASRDGSGQLPMTLRGVIPEYRLVQGTVDSALGVTMIPATVRIERGRVTEVVQGILGPRRLNQFVTRLAKAGS